MIKFKPILISVIFIFLVSFSLYGANPLRSEKRGICANKLSKEDEEVLQPGVSWWYNWFYKSDDIYEGIDMQFIPMVWGTNQEFLKAIKTFLDSGYKTKYLMAINEPNLKGQAYITPKECANLWGKIKYIAKQYDLKVVGPHMALGSATNASITAYDPIKKKEITYTFMIPYLNAFLSFAGGKDSIDYIGVHSYGDINELYWLIKMLDKKFPGKRVWVSEFAWWQAPSLNKEIEYLVNALELFEKAPNVEKYAWFKERAYDWKGDDGHAERLSLLEKKSGELTLLGKIYVNMPIHSNKIYHTVPGTIKAGYYSKAKGFKVMYSGDNNLFQIVHIHKKGDWVEYQLDVKKTGIYKMRLLVGSSLPVHIDIKKEKKIIGKIEEKKKEKKYWRILTTKITFEQGKNRIQLYTKNRGPKIKGIEFK